MKHALAGFAVYALAAATAAYFLYEAVGSVVERLFAQVGGTP